MNTIKLYLLLVFLYEFKILSGFESKFDDARLGHSESMIEEISFELLEF